MFPSWTWDYRRSYRRLECVRPRAWSVPGIIFTALALWPQIERWATGDNDYHPRQRPAAETPPTRVGFGFAGITFFYGISLAGRPRTTFHRQPLPDPALPDPRRSLATRSSSARWSPSGSPGGSASASSTRTPTCSSTAWRPGSFASCPTARFVEEERPLDEEEIAVLVRPAAGQAAGHRGGRTRTGCPPRLCGASRAGCGPRAKRAVRRGSLARRPPDGHGNGPRARGNPRRWGPAPGPKSRTESKPAGREPY